MTDPNALQSLVEAVCQSSKYAQMERGLIRALAEKELIKGRSPKEALKAVRTKLHQIGGAYQEKPIGYAQWSARLDQLPRDMAHPLVKQFCREMMAEHASTSERLPSLEHFYTEILTGLPPVSSLLDLACGLNPLSLPWLPLTAGAQVYACDVYTDLTAFLAQFFTHFGLNARAETCDLIDRIPQQPFQLALLLKTIPCLEQVDKSIGKRLLTQINADIMLVSFPVMTLGGRSKGMRQFYDAHFQNLIAGENWRVSRFEFANELVFRLERP